MILNKKNEDKYSLMSIFSLIILNFIVIFVSYTQCDPVNQELKDSKVVLDKSTNNQTLSLDQGKVPLSNHRMEETNQWSVENKTNDHSPEASILRPQLAVQIFADNSIPMRQKQHQEQQQQHHHHQQQQQHQIKTIRDSRVPYNSIYTNNHEQNSLNDISNVDPMIPNQSYFNIQNRDRIEEQFRQQNQFQIQQSQPQYTLNNNLDSSHPPLIEAKTNNELDSWRYLTDQATTIPINEQAQGRLQLDSNQLDINKDENNMRRPLLRAIISLPTQTGQDDSSESPTLYVATNKANLRDNQVSQTQTSKERHSTNNTSELDQQLAESRSSTQESDKKGRRGGNFEVSMSLNGDEIIITPLAESKVDSFEAKLESEINDKEKEKSSSSNKVSSNSRKQKRPIDRGRGSKAISLELADDQQLASQIVIVDGSGDDKADNNNNNNNNNNVRDGNDDSDNDDSNEDDSGDQEAKDSRSRGTIMKDSKRSSGNNLKNVKSEEIENINSEDQDYESEADDVDLNKDSNEDTGSLSSSNNLKADNIKLTRKTNARRNKSSGKIFPMRDKLVKLVSDTRRSKRISEHDKGIDSNSETDIVHPSGSSIVVKEEDLKKFELLLENLRSISLDNIKSLKGQRQVNKKYTSPDSKFDEQHEDRLQPRPGYFSSHTTRRKGPSLEASTKSDNQIKPQGSSQSNKVANRERDTIDTSTAVDCEHRDRPSYPKFIERTSELDDGNSESLSSSSIEHDLVYPESDDKILEQDDDGTGPIGLATTETILEASDDSTNRSNEGSASRPSLAHLRPFYVRKTTAQTYQRPSVEKNDSSGYSNWLRFNNDSNSLDYALTREQRSRKDTLERQKEPISRKRVYGQLGNYIDYNQLDTREVMRAVEGPKSMINKQSSLEQHQNLRSNGNSNSG